VPETSLRQLPLHSLGRLRVSRAQEVLRPSNTLPLDRFPLSHHRHSQARRYPSTVGMIAGTPRLHRLPFPDVLIPALGVILLASTAQSPVVRPPHDGLFSLPPRTFFYSLLALDTDSHLVVLRKTHITDSFSMHTNDFSFFDPLVW